MAAEPDTVTEAVRLLQSGGYVGTVTPHGMQAHCGGCGRAVHLEGLTVDHVYRFEGPSDPGDEAIVLGVRCPDCGMAGIVVSAFGPDADPDAVEILSRLSRRSD